MFYHALSLIPRVGFTLFDLDPWVRETNALTPIRSHLDNPKGFAQAPIEIQHVLEFARKSKGQHCDVPFSAQSASVAFAFLGGEKVMAEFLGKPEQAPNLSKLAGGRIHLRTGVSHKVGVGPSNRWFPFMGSIYFEAPQPLLQVPLSVNWIWGVNHLWVPISNSR